jgi:K+-transporting ATPase ATPase A chain
LTLAGWLQAAIVFGVIVLLVRPVGTYLYHVFEGKHTFLDFLFNPIERGFFRILRIDQKKETGWGGYMIRLLIVDFVLMFFAYLVLRFQGHLPLNPTHAPGMNPALAFNTTISFATNTNWQAYAGEVQVSYLSQMIVMTMFMFTSAASGIVVSIAVMRGISRRESKTVGNFYVDFTRAILRILLPLAIVGTIIVIPLGVIQNFNAPKKVTTVEGKTQTIPGGPVSSLESIKHLGNNGGGFYNANAAHPFENPNPITNVIFVAMMLLVPCAMPYLLGKYIGNTRQGWVIFVALFLLLVLIFGFTYWFESTPTKQQTRLVVNTSAGNTEGKEVRNGVAGSSLFGAATVSATTGSVDSSHDSFTPLGGMMMLWGMMLNTVFGAKGAGMVNVMIYVIFTVFIAGLMVGRTPEFNGKKIEGREVKLAVIALLAHPLTILAFVALSFAIPSARAAILNKGPHGITEITYAFTSATANNGSAMAGLNATGTYYCITTGIAMLIGRFAILIAMAAAGGSLAKKQIVPESEGTFRTDTWLFAGLLIGIIIIIGALTFFPTLALGPIAEQFLHI